MNMNHSTTRMSGLVLALSCLLSLSGSSIAADHATVITNSPAKLANQQRLQWHLTTLLGAYEKSGRKNPKWDVAISNALTAYAYQRASDLHTLDVNFVISEACNHAQAAGSDDPMVEYLLARQDDDNARKLTRDVKPAMRSAADRLFASDYPLLCKFNAASRAGARVKVLTGTGSEFPPEILQYRKRALEYLLALLQDRTVPPVEIVDACSSLFDGLQGDEPALETNWKEIEPALLKHWTNAYLHHLIRGTYYRSYAWGARGSLMADTVTDKGWDRFGKRLKLAATEFETAWKLNPQEGWTARAMIGVNMGLGAEAAELEKWFQRAMQANPDDYTACIAMHTSLERKWGGTPEQMLSFARRCATSTNWGGSVPLILDQAHDTISKYGSAAEYKEYWKSESIWKEIKAAYDKYYQTRRSTFPDTGTRTKLARAAYRTQHYEEFLELIDGMKAVDLAQFGGVTTYDGMVAYAESVVAKSKKAVPAATKTPIQTEK